MEHARVALRLGQALNSLGEFVTAANVLAAGLDALSQGTPAELRRDLESELVGVAVQDPQLMPMVQTQLEVALAATGGAVEGLDPLLKGVVACGAISFGQREMGVTLAREALKQPAPATPGVPLARAFATRALFWAGQLEEQLTIWDAEEATARQHVARIRLSWACNNRAQVLVRLGRPLDAEADARIAVELAEALFLRPLPISYAVHAETLIELGQNAEARTAIGRSGLDQRDHDDAIAIEPLRIRARLRAEEGDLDGARADVARIRRLAEQYNVLNGDAMPWRVQSASLTAAAGDRSAALSLVEDEIDKARTIGSPRALGTALSARGLLLGRDGMADLSEAVEVLEASDDRLEHLRALLALGSALRRAGQRAAARVPLREVLDGAFRGGAKALAARAREELAASGARPRRDELRGRDALTASERRTAMLAAEGRTNREIAQLLFVSLRTVETHLTHAYAKLDVQGRNALRQALA